MTSNVISLRPPLPELSRADKEKRVLEIEATIDANRYQLAVIVELFNKLKAEHAALLAQIRQPVSTLSPLRTAFASAKFTEDL